MNEQEDRQELRESWIGSLLVSATTHEDHEDRIARAMRQIDDAPTATLPTPSARARSKSARWGTIGIAAALLLAAFLATHTVGTSRSAMAAVERSLDVAAQSTTRKYLMQVEFRPTVGGVRETENDLYVQGNDRFALRHPGLLPGTSFWLGRDGDDSWVAPAFGPVRKGDNTILARWIRSRESVGTPYLHLSTLLERMSHGYRLKTLSDERVVLSDGTTIACRHIRAELQTSDGRKLPDTIELWASRETGMAVRIHSRWKLPEGEIGTQSILLTFQSEEPALPADWFTAEAHYEGERPVKRVDASEQ